jgi:hypothetical protein
MAANYEDPLGPKYEGRFAEDGPVSQSTIRIVTYNINRGLEVNQAIEELHTYQALRDPDILLLQGRPGPASQLRLLSGLGFPLDQTRFRKRDPDKMASIGPR